MKRKIKLCRETEKPFNSKAHGTVPLCFNRKWAVVVIHATGLKAEESTFPPTSSYCFSG